MDALIEKKKIFEKKVVKVVGAKMLVSKLALENDGVEK